MTVGVVEGDARFRGGGFDLRAEFAAVLHRRFLPGERLPRPARPGRGPGRRSRLLRPGRLRRARLGDAATRQELLFFGGVRERQPAQRDVALQLQPADDHAARARLPPDAPSPSRSFVRGGIDYRPRPELAFKVDVQVALDGEGPPPTTPVTATGAPGHPAPAPEHELAEAARGKTAGRPGASASRSDIDHASIRFIRFSALEPGHRGQGALHGVLRAHVLGVVSSALYYGDLVGAGTSGIKSYYAGEARGRAGAGRPRSRARPRPGPRSTSPRTRARPPADRRRR